MFLSSICSNSKNLFWWFCREWKCFCNDFFYSFLGCKIFNNYFSLYTIWKDRVKYKRNFIALISVIVYAFSYLAAKNAYTLFILLRYYQYILLIVLFICPIIIYTLAYFKRQKFKYLK